MPPDARLSDALAHSCWREVEARVHVSLTPQELATNARMAATRAAFQSLLMRFSPSLKGVPVAHRGGLRLSKTATFVGSSPYAHLHAFATLLVFAPPRGAELVGSVTRVGPDHIALSVLGAFHAVLPLDPLRDFYAYDYRISEAGEGLIKKWRALQNAPGFEEDIAVGRQVRFVVEGMKPAQSGLFQILASLNESRRMGPEEGRMPLGVIASESEVKLSIGDADLGGSAFRTRGAGVESDEDVIFTTPALSAGRRSSASRARASSLSGDILSGNRFGNALMVTPASAKDDSTKKKKKKKKKRRESKSADDSDSGGLDTAARNSRARKSVKFEGMETGPKEEPYHMLVDVDSAVQVFTSNEAVTPADSHSAGKSRENNNHSSSKEKKKRKKDRAKQREAGREKSGHSEERKKKKKKKEKKEKKKKKKADGLERVEKEEGRMEEVKKAGKEEDQLSHEVLNGHAVNGSPKALGVAATPLRTERAANMPAAAAEAVAVRQADARAKSEFVLNEANRIESTSIDNQTRDASSDANRSALSPGSEKIRSKKKRKRDAETGTDEERKRKKKRKKEKTKNKKEEDIVTTANV